MDKQEQWMVLVGPGFYDAQVQYCTETAKLYRWPAPSGVLRTVRKADYVGVVVEDKAHGKALCGRIDNERHKDSDGVRAYYNKLADWHRANPKPKALPAREVLAALGITVAEAGV